jgi:hypothetical protein
MEFGPLQWLLAFSVPVFVGYWVWKTQRVQIDPVAQIKKALERVSKAHYDRLYYALPCEFYAGEQTLVGVLAVIEGRLRFETLAGDRDMDIDFPRITAYHFGLTNSKGFKRENYRAFRLTIGAGLLEFGIPAWGEKNVSAAMKAATGKSVSA